MDTLAQEGDKRAVEPRPARRRARTERGVDPGVVRPCDRGGNLAAMADRHQRAMLRIAIHQYGVEHLQTLGRRAVRGQLHGRVSTVVVLARRQSHRRSEEHTSELQSLMSISYDDVCVKKKKK